MIMRRLLIAGIRLYQLTLRAFIGCHCRFFPTCSDYAIEALEKHGCVRGSRLILSRLARCHPFAHGGHDPVPEPMKNMRSTGRARMDTW